MSSRLQLSRARRSTTRPPVPAEVVQRAPFRHVVAAHGEWALSEVPRILRQVRTLLVVLTVCIAAITVGALALVWHFVV